MEVARWPYSLSNVLKTNGLERFVTMMLPVGSGVGVPVQGDPQTTNRTSHPLPAGWPLVLRDSDPSGIASQFCLEVRLNGVRLLYVEPVSQPVGVDEASCLHRGGRTSKV